MDQVTTRGDVHKALFKYLDTDTIWYGTPLPINHTRLTQWVSFHQGHPEPLVRLQNNHWDPLLNWARETFDIELLISDSLLLNAQPEATKRKLDEVLQGFDPWQMAGCVSFILLSHVILKFVLWTAMERVTFTTKSFIIALALIHGRITAERAALASQVEVASQIERWGEVEDCTYNYFFRASGDPPEKPSSRR
jgi:ATP synthase mitochondrial F1 complex assembly factor 2